MNKFSRQALKIWFGDTGGPGAVAAEAEDVVSGEKKAGYVFLVDVKKVVCLPSRVVWLGEIAVTVEGQDMLLWRLVYDKEARKVKVSYLEPEMFEKHVEAEIKRKIESWSSFRYTVWQVGFGYIISPFALGG